MIFTIIIGVITFSIGVFGANLYKSEGYLHPGMKIGFTLATAGVAMILAPPLILVWRYLP